MKEELKEKIQLLRPRRVSAAAAFATARGPVFGRLRPFTVLYSRSLSYQFVVFDLETLGTGGSMCAISSTSAIMPRSIRKPFSMSLSLQNSLSA